MSIGGLKEQEPQKTDILTIKVSKLPVIATHCSELVLKYHECSIQFEMFPQSFSSMFFIPSV